ncbi:MAG TPA: class I SAM-dependent methyltransferase [Rudaea sp.]|nr:class I SAM-dependent methyltransferase [Rudaea sp.]
MTLLDSLFGTRCRLCGKRAASTIGSVAPTHPGNFQTKQYTLQHCRKCDVVYLHPLPNASDLKLLYEDSVQFSSDHYTDPEQVRKILDYYGTELASLQLLRDEPCRVLEIGAGLAWVSRAAKGQNPNAHTVAQDVSGECAQACPWVDTYFVGTLDALPDRAPYDLISLTHVIEHLADPAAILKDIAALLARGGNVFMTAPFRPPGWTASTDIAAWRDYSYLHVPAHITYFSERWFEQQAHALGLEIAHWNAAHEDGQAFAVVLHKP